VTVPEVGGSEPLVSGAPTPGSGGGALSAAGRRRGRAGWLPLVLVGSFLAAIAVKSFVLEAFFIPSGSMRPTLRVGDRVLVEKLGYRFGGPHRGDVVVFETSPLAGAPIARHRSALERLEESVAGLLGPGPAGREDLIKRVVAVGGDRVEAHDGVVFVNGRPLRERYLKGPTPSFNRMKVPDGHLFVLGDNRFDSRDSRSFGPVPEDSVVGHAFFLMWPPRDLGTL
jgi:signal peptidase I